MSALGYLGSVGLNPLVMRVRASRKASNETKIYFDFKSSVSYFYVKNIG
jgi:hypothetical protein